MKRLKYDVNTHTPKIWETRTKRMRMRKYEV